MAKKVFFTSFVIAAASLIGIVICYILLNHEVDLIGTINVAFWGFVFVCLFTPSALVAIFFAFLHFILPDNFYLGNGKIKS